MVNLLCRLLTNELRMKRGLTVNASCPRCGYHIEDMEHLLRDCVVTKDVWINVAGLHWFSKDKQLNLNSWLKRNSKPHSQTDPYWNIVFVVSLWQIWNDRNKKVFENSDPILHKTLSFIYNYASVIKQAFTRSVILTQHSPQLIKWFPPPIGKIKLNMDGCARGDPGEGGFGGVFRDEKGV